ncbi:MAG: S41 family peptidase [Oscillospiraceae bacterium]|nr:S41 family peptidase [Oscillospiraceae bacterium]
MENKISTTKAFLAALISSAITGTVIFGLCNEHFSDLKEKENTIQEIFEVKDYIDELFYDDIDDETLITSALKGLVSGLDDNYAAYMTPEEYEQSVINVQGSLTGIGISVIQNDEKKVEIVSITENSPASKYDIKSGDILTAIDGIDAENIEYDNLVNLVRGKEGTDVTITLDRNGKKLEHTITREKIDTITVTYEMLENNIAYIKITGFKETTVEQYEEALDNALKDNAQGIIFDLRDNGGGLLTSCSSCLDPLLPKGVVATANYKNGKTEVICESDAEELDLPMAVLVNENTASAAELFASALRDFDKAKLVGKNTFGKGIMQNTVKLKNGGGLKITVATYKTAKSECYHKIGLAPDYEIDIPEDIDISKANPEKDTQLQKAIDILK